ncbi:hypothetical protein PYCCODRAFT_1357999 [Trametes coccinea BRFM310]|uniref:Uncharacterized protein n=1 Tax=Trametes coccinea (strain BRFM310) TaxID=1353009 RepID=A0A1Y2J314_TRAC3|nr:hypothetical protein PYCCODRAFT_1357999 [Trametes coccinea BRFM310]
MLIRPPSCSKRRDARGSLPFSRSEAERLIKQTYSVRVSLPEDRPRGITRKWHLTAYFNQTAIDSLGTIDDIPGVGDVVVPEGWFKSARASKVKKRIDPPPAEDIGPTTHDSEPWGVTMPPVSSHPVPQYGVETTPKWPNLSPRMSHSTHVGQSSYAVCSSTYLLVPYPYDSLSHHYQYPQGAPLPNLRDTALSIYRDSSPYTQSSSSSSDPLSPRPFSSPLTPPSNVSLPLSVTAERAAPQLVPLSYLQGLQQRPRDPMDEHYLKRFSSPNISSHESHRRSWDSLNGRSPLYDRFAEDEAKPTLVQSSWW